MADNVTANAGSGGAVFATDDVSSVHYPINKLAHGALDSVTLVSTSSGLPVQQQGAWNITDVSGTISLPTGAATEATLGAIQTAVEIIDDWDETNRCAVNLIAAQAGITGGAGAVAANTPRVTLASDDPGIASLATIAGDTTSLDGKVTACNTGAVVISSGSVTANAGTNLNTSALALETGGNLDTIAGDTTSIDGKITACDTGSVTVAAVTPDLMLGTDFSTVMGTSAINQGAGTDTLANSGNSARATSLGYVFNGTTWDRMRGGGETGSVLVDLGANNDVTVTSQPSRAATTDTITAKLATDAIQNGTTALTPKFANLSTASTGDQALIAAVAGKKLRILALQIVATASTNAIYINDGTANLYADGTNKLQLDDTGATGPGGYTLPFNPLGWFETADVNRPININLGSTNGVVAIATYVEV